MGSGVPNCQEVGWGCCGGLGEAGESFCGGFLPDFDGLCVSSSDDEVGLFVFVCIAQNSLLGIGGKAGCKDFCASQTGRTSRQKVEVPRDTHRQHVIDSVS